MSDIRIRNVDESIRSALKIKAIEKATTLENLIKKILEEYLNAN